MNNLKLDLSPEEDLLLNLCRLSFSSEQRRKIEELIAGLPDWEHFIWMINEYGIISITYHNIEHLGLAYNIPENIQTILKSLYLKTLARNTFLVEKFVELQKSLKGIGINPVVLKGMALEPGVYDNIGLRQISDIDLYIGDRNECLKAWQHLVNSGYTPRPLKSELHNKILLDFGKHMPDLYKDGISIDLHNSLFDIEHHIDTISISTGRSELTIPAYDIHFLYIAKHLKHHELSGQSQLKFYIDLYRIIWRADLDVTSTRFIDLADKLGLKTILFEKLFLLHLIWSTPITEEISNQLTSAQKAEFIITFTSFLRDRRGQKGKNKGGIYREIIRNIPTLREKLIFLLGDIFPSVSFMQNRYNTRTRIGACLYYPIRLGKLLLLFIR